MYTAIQARNIAIEKQNHRYYRMYRWRVRDIMHELTRRANNGESEFRYYAKRNSSLEARVLRQICNELNQIGYNCKVSYEKNDKDKKIWFMDLNWEV